MYPTNLVTNEVKNSAGTEEEFLRQSLEGRRLVFTKSGVAPNAPHLLTISHSEVGVGAARRRRSMLRVDKTVSGASGTQRVVSAYTVVDFPVGDLAASTDLGHVLANLISNLASTGADTTIKYDCTGFGALALLEGSL